MTKAKETTVHQEKKGEIPLHVTLASLFAICLIYTGMENNDFWDSMSDSPGYFFGLLVSSLVILLPVSAVVGFIVWFIVQKINDENFAFSLFWIGSLVLVVGCLHGGKLYIENAGELESENKVAASELTSIQETPSPASKEARKSSGSETRDILNTQETPSPESNETREFSGSEALDILTQQSERVAKRAEELGRTSNGIFSSFETFGRDGSKGDNNSSGPLSYVDILQLLPDSQTENWTSKEDAVRWLQENRPDLLEKSPELLEVRDRLEEEESSGFLKGILGGGSSSD